MDTYDIPLTIICDLGKNTATPQVISINQNEANIKKLRVEFVSGGKPWEIPTGFSCNILMKKADGFAVDNPAESISGNAAVFNITPQMTAAVGENYFQIQVVKSEDDARGFAAVLSVQKAVLADDDIISEDEKETINGLIDRAENAVQEAEEAVDDAQSAVNNAQTAVKDADEAVDKANQATQDVQDALDQIIAASGNLIDDSKATSATTYSSNKIEGELGKRVPFSGGTMTGPLNLYRTLRITDDLGVTKEVLFLYNPGTAEKPETFGDELLFSGGGNVFIGSGESPETLRNALIEAAGEAPEDYGSTSERLYLSADSTIMYFTNNCNDTQNRHSFAFHNNAIRPAIAHDLFLGHVNLPFEGAFIDKVYETTSPMYQKKVGFFGDSLTWGQTANTSTKSANPYPKVFCDHYKCTMYNFGVQGATGSQSGSKTFDDQITANQNTIKSLDYAFIMFGTNDFSRNIEPGNLSQDYNDKQCATTSLAYGLCKGIDRIYTLNPDIQIILIIPPYVQTFYKKPYWSNGIGLQRENYNSAIQEVGRVYNIEVLDLTRTGFGPNESAFYSDTTHFNDAGYAVLGNMLIHQFQSQNSKHEYDYYESKLTVNGNTLPTNLFDITAKYATNVWYDGTYYTIKANTPITSKPFQIIGNKGRLSFKCYCATAESNTVTVTIKNAEQTYTTTRQLVGKYNMVSISFAMSESSTPHGDGCTISISTTQDCYLSGFALNYNSIQSTMPKRSVTEKLDITMVKSGATPISYILHMKNLTLEYDLILTGITSLASDEVILTAALPSDLPADLFKTHPSNFIAVNGNGEPVALQWKIEESKITLKSLAAYSGKGTIYVAGAMPFMIDDRIYTVCCD